jgi:hypothetical protein
MITGIKPVRIKAEQMKISNAFKGKHRIRNFENKSDADKMFFITN